MSIRGTIPKRKVDAVNNLIDLLSEHRTVGIVEMSSIGANTVQKLRADLRASNAKMVVSKNTLMRKALDMVEVEGSELLKEFVKGSVAFLFTNASPYAIANYLDKNKVKAPAKGGQIAPKSVTIPKLNTGFPPGTIISELNSVGLPTRIEGGTVAISAETVVVEEGQRVSTTLASILSRLEIEPFEVGLSLDVVLVDGQIIQHDDLIIDFDAFRNDLIFAHKGAMSVAMKAGYLTEETAPMVIATAQNNAYALASSIGYITEETAPRVFARANANALALIKAVLEHDKSAVPAELAKMAA